MSEQFKCIPDNLDERVNLCYQKAEEFNVTLINFDGSSLTNKKALIKYQCNKTNQSHQAQFRNFVSTLKACPCCKNNKKRVFDIPRDIEQRKEILNQRTKQLNIKLINPENISFSNLKTKIDYICLRHNARHCTELRRLLVEIQRPRCCENEARQLGLNANVKNLLIKRNHQTVPENPATMKTPIIIICNIHGYQIKTTGEQYQKREKYGLKCCYNAARSSSLKHRFVKNNTISLRIKNQKLSLNNDPVVKKTRAFRKAVRERDDYTCFFTGISQKTHPEQIFAVHHLYSKKAHPKLRYEPLNGIVLIDELHRMFHTHLGTQSPVTPRDLIKYIKSIYKLSKNSKIKLTNSNKEILLISIDEKIKLLEERDIELSKLLNS